MKDKQIIKNQQYPIKYRKPTLFAIHGMRLSVFVINKVFLFLLLSGLGIHELYTQHQWNYIQIDSSKQKWGDWATPDWLRYFGLDAGDVNRDGLKDIVSGRYIYHNPGGDMQYPWRRTVLDDNVDVILFMDVDGDPYADLIAQALPNLYWLEATDLQGTKYTMHLIGSIPATSHVNSQGFEKAQIIKGGPLEFVIAGNGNIYCISIPAKNPKKTPWTIKKIAQNTPDEGIGIGDIDGDGDLDIAAGRRAEGEEEPRILIWYENPGTIDTLWKEKQVGSSQHPIDRIEIADLNGDQKADIIITEERYPGLAPDAQMFWFQQNTPTSWKRHLIVKQYSMNNLDIEDPDQDGDWDIITSEHKGKNLALQLWRNDGNANFVKEVLDTGKENHLGTQFADLDGDGDLDLYSAGWDQHQFMHVWRNDRVKTPTTGDVFREYKWTPDGVNDKGKFLRVGGKLDYQINPDHFPAKHHKQGNISLAQHIDLEKAYHAEVIVERVQSHEDTKNLSISINNNPYHLLPEPTTLPEKPTDYMFHANIRIPIPIKELKHGSTNVFKFRVDKDQSWNWPQNLIYGLVLRIYYTDQKRTLNAHLKGIRHGDMLGEKVSLSIAETEQSEISSVDYIGLYEDVNWQGDGIYRTWQYQFHRTAISNHIGSSKTAPFAVKWSTEWLPDQDQPIKVRARIKMKDGLMFLTPVIDHITLKRDHRVFLAKPHQQPPFWVSRNGEHANDVAIPFSIPPNSEAILYWKSWSPCYSEGIMINDHFHQANNKAPCYDAFLHEEQLKNTEGLKAGNNRIKTLKTPLYDGKMVHGMEVQWPGIMMKIKYKAENITENNIRETIYENRKHFVIHTKALTYYYDPLGGGFSRIIDNYGNDWISFRKKPWNQYPASAASSYRGLPNFVFGSDDNGAGHPGFDQCKSILVDGNTIVTQSNSGKWQWQWTFFDTYAVVEMTQTDPEHPYWFLYEGTPGGKYNSAQYYYGTNLSGPIMALPDLYRGTAVFDQYEWAYFGRSVVQNTLFLIQLNKDHHKDMMAYLGNSKAGVESTEGMTVFGFGRGENTKPLLAKTQKFIVGMYPRSIHHKEQHKKISQHINALISKHQ